MPTAWGIGHSDRVSDVSPAPGDVPVRPAATVLLVRDGERGLEVFAQTRASTMAFAPGMTAFPGGGVDPTDADLPPWTGRSAADWDDLLGRPDGARLVVAGARELFEEVGVLVAAAALEPDPERWIRARRDVTAHLTPIAAVYRDWDTALPGDLFAPWSRWITPPEHRRRYDTHFLLAAVPPGQEAVLDTTEATEGGWARPADLLDQAAAGRRRVMLPTQVTLAELADHDDVASALAAPRSMVPAEPVLVSGPDEPQRVRLGDRELTLFEPSRRFP